MSDINAGLVHTHPYPFVRCTYQEFCGMDDVRDIGSWKPGTRYESCGRYGEDVECIADAMGEQTLTVIDVHKPGRYPTRVFYTTQYRTPDGKLFGKTKLHITTLEAFRRRLSGYMHEFRVEDIGIDQAA